MKEREAQLDLLKHEHAVAMSKKMITEAAGLESFTKFEMNNSILSNTPSPHKKDRASLNLGGFDEEAEN